MISRSLGEGKGCSNCSFDLFNLILYFRPDSDIALFVGNNFEFDEKHLITINEFEFFPHPIFDESPDNETDIEKQNRTNNFDIGLIVLKKKIDIRRFVVNGTNHLRMNTICLPKEEYIQDKYVEKPATFFGWGKVPNNSKPVTLKRGDIVVGQRDDEDCYFGFCFVSPWLPGYVTSCKVSVYFNYYPVMTHLSTYDRVILVLV